MPEPVYHKRYRMECRLRRGAAPPELPAGYGLLPWAPELLTRHAVAKAASFSGELDSLIFPSLGGFDGCLMLMSAIAAKPGFVPGSTWLLAGPGGDAGTVQGLRDDDGLGAVQNLGVVPAERGRGFGELLLACALAGFRAAGLARAHLEVTASNAPAVRLYRRLGFRAVRTVYKPVPPRPRAPVPHPAS